MGRVQDQVAVVTGAGQGLGRAIAVRLAEEGARLALGDIDGAGLERTVAASREGGQPSPWWATSPRRSRPHRSIATRVERCGRLDILVNDVGGSRNARSGR